MALFDRKPAEPKAPKKPREAPKRLPVTQRMCDAFVQVIAVGWSMSPWRTDALDDNEQTALSKSLYQTAKQNVFLGNLIYKIVQVEGEAQLVAVVGAIAVTRLARHAIVPAVLELPAQMVIAKVAGEEVPEVEVSGDVETGGARGPGRIDGDGQNDAGGAIVDLPPLRDQSAYEVGRSGLAGVQDDSVSARNGWRQTEQGWEREAPAPRPPRATRVRVPRSDPESV